MTTTVRSDRPLTVEEAVARARARNGEIRAILLPLFDQALERAQALEKEPPRSELHGIPYVLKDIWDTAGIRTTGGSWRHRERVPDKSCSIHEALDRAGAVLIGKSNLPDLSLPPETDNHLIGRACNPLNPTRTPGGSSGGGAAAVADRMAELEWGSDFGGSIRLPSAFCGVFGLRLSASAWSAHEHFPLLPPELLQLNGMGPIARTVDRIRSVLRVLAPSLRRGSPSAFRPRGLAVLAPGRLYAGEWPSFADDARAAAREVGFGVRAADTLPPPLLIDSAYDGFLCSRFEKMIATGEIPFREGLGAALSALTIGRLLGDRRIHPMSAQLLLLIALGRVTLYSRPARQAARREAVIAAASALWSEGWLIAAPTCTYPAPPHGQVLKRRGMLAFTKLGNLIDATALALPFGRYGDGMPRSLQILGPPGSEHAVLDAGERLAATAR